VGNEREIESSCGDDAPAVSGTGNIENARRNPTVSAPTLEYLLIESPSTLAD
jgi:hypothetical protein